MRSYSFKILLLFICSSFSLVFADQILIKKEINHFSSQPTAEELEIFGRDFNTNVLPEDIYIKINNNDWQEIPQELDSNSPQQYSSASFSINPGDTFVIGVGMNEASSISQVVTKPISYDQLSEDGINTLTIRGNILPLNVIDNSGRQISKFYDEANQTLEAVNARCSFNTSHTICKFADSNSSEFNLGGLTGNPFDSLGEIFNARVFVGTAYIKKPIFTYNGYLEVYNDRDDVINYFMGFNLLGYNEDSRGVIALIGILPTTEKLKTQIEMSNQVHPFF